MASLTYILWILHQYSKTESLTFERNTKELYFLLANHDFGNRVVVLLRCSVWINQYELPSNVFVAISAKRFNLKHIRVCIKCCQKCKISLRCRAEGLQRIPSKGMYVFGIEKLTFNTAVFTLLSAAVGETPYWKWKTDCFIIRKSNSSKKKKLKYFTYIECVRTANKEVCISSELLHNFCQNW